ncbi:MAG: YfjI family protein [Solirubrobacteraceae bacterium]|nr:YfjI family protein [Solirubrobacteraceae bacterium]
MSALEHLAPLGAEVWVTSLGAAVEEACEHTEADPAAVLLHVLAGVGSAVGPHAYADWSGHRTPARLFGLVIGGTGSGKGAAESVALRMLRDAAGEWADENIVGGLVSGEGLLAALGGERGDDGEGEPAAPTGRHILVVEPEFGRVLAAGNRDGATLTHLLRELWDKDRAASLSRQRPLRVTGAHLSIVGHITPTELQRLADANAIENGTINRFMPVAITRGALRPFGDPPSSLAAERRRGRASTIAAAIDFGRSAGRIDLDPDARERWAELYLDLAREQPGMVGTLGTRGIAHLQRVALILAIGDRDHLVRRVHLDAAAAVWDRASAAWRSLYGDRLGDPLADLLAGLVAEAGPTGLTRQEIRRAIGNRESAARIDTARDTLQAAGRIVVAREPSGGPPVERWTVRDGGSSGSGGGTPGSTSSTSTTSTRSTLPEPGRIDWNAAAGVPPAYARATEPPPDIAGWAEIAAGLDEGRV